MDPHHSIYILRSPFLIRPEATWQRTVFQLQYLQSKYGLQWPDILADVRLWRHTGTVFRRRNVSLAICLVFVFSVEPFHSKSVLRHRSEDPTEQLHGRHLRLSVIRIWRQRYTEWEDIGTSKQSIFPLLLSSKHGADSIWSGLILIADSHAMT